MKKFVIILMLPIMVLLHGSCDGLLDIEPENSLTYYNYFKSEQDLEVAMYGAYEAFRASYRSPSPRAISGEVMDECGDRNIEALRILDATTLTSAVPSCSWASHYKTISQAMMVAENLGQAGLSKERHDFWLGQALFYKAISYFYVVRDWGDCPYLKESYKVDPEERKPWQDVLDYAIEDMKQVTELLDFWKNQTDANGDAVTYRQMVGKEAAYAILAYMYAWKANLSDDEDALQKAIDAATWVIEKGGIGFAADPEEVCTEVLMGGHPESIFEIDVDYSDFLFPDVGINLEYYYQTWPIRPYTEPGDVTGRPMKIRAERVLKMYKEGDKRRDSYFYKPAEYIDTVSTGGWALMQRRREVIEDRSFPDFPDFWFKNYAGNILVTRLADILLLRAECYAKRGDDNLAKPDLDRVRERAGVPGYTSVEGPIYRMIFEEREKELLLEKHRWYDMVRTGYWKTDMTEEYSKLTEQDVEDGALYLPVYVKAFTSNPLMRQNRYWNKRY